MNAPLRCLGIVTALAIIQASLNAQPLVLATPGQYARGQLLGALSQYAATVGEWSKRNSELTNEIQVARKQFWNAPEGAERQAAAKHFEDALIKKDLHFAKASLWNSPGGNQALMKLTLELTGEFTVDGGISPYCYDKFRVWAEQVAGDVSETRNLDKALERALPLYLEYRYERDIAEFLFFNPHSILRAAQPPPREYLAAWLLGVKTARNLESANAIAAALATKVNDAQMVKIAQVARSWAFVTTSIKGPRGGRFLPLYDPTAKAPTSAIATVNWPVASLDFSELRGILVGPHVNEAAALDDIKKLWQQARATKDYDILLRAVEQRDALILRVAKAIETKVELWGNDWKNNLTRLKLNLNFMDRCLESVEQDMAQTGQMNPRALQAEKITQEFLGGTVRSSATEPIPSPKMERGPQRGPARGAAVPVEQRPPPAPKAVITSSTPQALPVPAAKLLASKPNPTPSELRAEQTGIEEDGPLARAILLSQDPYCFLITQGHVSEVLHRAARDWEKYIDLGNSYSLKLSVEGMNSLVNSALFEIRDQLILLDSLRGRNVEASTKVELRIRVLKEFVRELRERLDGIKKVYPALTGMPWPIEARHTVELATPEVPREEQAANSPAQAPTRPENFQAPPISSPATPQKSADNSKTDAEKLKKLEDTAQKAKNFFRQFKN